MLIKTGATEDPATFGHQAFLRGLQLAGAVLSIQELDTGEIYAGIVKHSDATTISIRVDRADGTYQSYVIFKHAIKKFWVDPKNQLPKLAH